MFWRKNDKYSIKNEIEKSLKNISTDNFYYKEYFYSITAKDKDIDNIPTNLAIVRNAAFTLKNLQQIRNYIKKPIYITSGFRSEKLNKEVGGSPKSQHMLGLAADIVCPGVVEETLAEEIRKSRIIIDQCIIEYKKNSSWVHLGFKQQSRNSFLIYKDGKYSLMS